MTDGRTRSSRVLAGLCLTALCGSTLVAAPSHAEPDIDTVATKVERLYHQAEQASERYNEARLRMRRAQHRLEALRAGLRRQQHEVETVRTQVASAVVAQYQGQGISSTAQLLLSADPDAFIDRLTTVSAFNDQRSALMADYVARAERLEARSATARVELDRIAATQQQLGKEKAEIDDKAAQAKQLLDTLKERAAARASRSRARAAAAAAAAGASGSAVSPEDSGASSTDGAGSAAPASGRAAAAVAYAMAQVGKAYVYGAAGPSAFDCSGLTMMAWAQAGVSLPHSSSAQMGSGTPVSQSELQPGDLVFYYSPVSHVGMYIGNGRIVNALNPGAGVDVSDVNSMPYSGAVRPG
jgi:cell wall-associated NlpC family hydrolase